MDDLRRKVRELEKTLSSYGFDERRGIETYKVSEVKKVLQRAGTREDEARRILKELIEVQLTLYRELYRVAGIRDIVVDTDMPEKKVKEIGDWLEGGRKENRGGNAGLFARTVNDVLNMIKESKDASSVMELLTASYKRDYDRFRVLEFLAELCEELGVKVKRPKNLDELANTTITHVLEASVDKVRELATVKLKA